MSAKKSIYTFLTLYMSVLACGILTACLHIPSEPSASGKATSLTVYVSQNKTKDSTLLKISTQDTATFVAQVRPTKYKDKLTYSWYHDNEFLGSGATYTDLFLQNEDVPNRVVVVDKEGNFMENTFDFILNTPPRLGATTFPADSAHFYITKYQSIEFKWFVFDANDKELTSYLTIDSEEYNVQSLTSVYQSGFNPGWHSYKITVMDRHGDKATSPKRYFKIEDPMEEK